jgi:hypothetical protein
VSTRRTLAHAILATALAVTAAPRLAAQVVGPLPDSAVRAFYAERADEYAAESRAMREAGGRVTRRERQLVIRTRHGPPVVLTDTIAEGDSHVQHIYHGFLRGPGLHVVELRFYEGGASLVVYDATGSVTYLPGPPLLSPDGTHFASASFGGEAGYDPNHLEIWRVTPTRLRREFDVDGGSAWGPDSLAWHGHDTLEFRRMVMGADFRWSSTPVRVVRAKGRWEMRQ